MPTGIKIPGSPTIGQVERMLLNLERNIGLGSQAISGEAYWSTLRELILSVPSTQPMQR